MADEPDTLIRVVVIVCLTAVLVVAEIGIMVVAVATDRDLFRVEVLTFAGVLLLAAFGGITWWGVWRRHHWRIQLDRDNGDRSRE